MKQKYQKPISRNLGEVLPNVEGLCAPTGSVARGIGGDCVPNGGIAGGYGCAVYGAAPASSCTVGNSADNPSGCSFGGVAAY